MFCLNKAKNAAVQAFNRIMLALAAVIVYFGMESVVLAQTTFTVSDLLDEADVDTKVTDAATAIGALLGTIVLVALAFLLVMRGRREAGNAIKGRS